MGAVIGRLGEGEGVIEIESLDSWKEQMEKAKLLNSLVVVCFGAPCCGPSRFISWFVEAAAVSIPEVVFLRIDTDQLESIGEEWEVDAIPTFIFLRDGKLVDKVIGAKFEELRAKVMDHIVPPRSRL